MAKGIVAQTSHKNHALSQTTGGYSLIGALAALIGEELATHDRFTGLGNMIHADNHVRVAAADNDNLVFFHGNENCFFCFFEMCITEQNDYTQTMYSICYCMEAHILAFGTKI